jgi:hypothetical protein
LGKPNENLWIALVLLLMDMEPVLYLITHFFMEFLAVFVNAKAFPSKVFSEPDDYIFIDNEQGERFKHLSNWETVGSRVPLKSIIPRVN